MSRRGCVTTHTRSSSSSTARAAAGPVCSARGLDVWEVIATVRDNNGSIPEAAEYLQIPAGLAKAAVAYYGEYRDEIDREIELNEAAYERGRAAAAAGERALRS